MTIISVIYLLTIILGLVFPKTRRVTALMLIVIWALYAFNDNNSDYINYYRDYLKIGRGDFKSFGFHEEGYIYFAYVSSKYLHLDYQGFLILSSTICTPILGYVVCKLSPQPNSALSLFMLNPYWVMICQTRFYFAFLIVMVGFIALHELGGRHGTIAYVVAVAVASLFHRASLLCLVFAFSRAKSLKDVVKFAIMLLPAAASFNIPAVRSIGVQLIGQEKADVWLLSETNRSFLGIILLCSVHLALLVVALIAYKDIAGRELGEKKEWATPLVKAAVLAIAFLPLECLDRNYERYARFLLMFIYLLRGHYADKEMARRLNAPAGLLLMDLCIIGYYVLFSQSFKAWLEHNLTLVMTSSTLL